MFICTITIQLHPLLGLSVLYPLKWSIQTKTKNKTDKQVENQNTVYSTKGNDI